MKTDFEKKSFFRAINLRRYAIGTVLALVVIFLLQNVGSTEVEFLFWRFETSKAFLILLSLILGMAMAQGLRLIRLAKRRTEEKAEAA